MRTTGNCIWKYSGHAQLHSDTVSRMLLLRKIIWVNFSTLMKTFFGKIKITSFKERFGPRRVNITEGFFVLMEVTGKVGKKPRRAQ